jgi:cytoskeletal protein CcmA (bactofilin family)
LRTKLKAYGDLIFRHRTVALGPISAEQVFVHSGARVSAQRIVASVVEVKGYLHVETLVASRKLVIEAGGYLWAKSIRTAEVEVQRSGGLEGEFESIPLPSEILSERDSAGPAHDE